MRSVSFVVRSMSFTVRSVSFTVRSMSFAEIGEFHGDYRGGRSCDVKVAAG